MTYKPTVEELKGLSPVEQARLIANKGAEADRVEPVEQERKRRLRSFVQSGGSEEAFNEHWELAGRDAFVIERAAERERMARESSQVF